MKTAFEEFIDLLYRNYPDSNLGFDWEYFKELEKQQISQAFDFGFDRDDMSGDEYYKNTYKNISK